jgi:SseB protein N-terminal domain
VQAVGENLFEESAATYAGYGNPPSLLQAARESLLWLPVDEEAQPLCVDAGGVAWVCAFTSERELAEFGIQRGEADQEWSYLTMRGSRLFDEVIAACPVPTGVAVNVAGAQPMMFPPEMDDE